MVHRHLDHTKALRCGEHRYESVEVILQDNRFNNLTTKGLQPTVMIVQLEACQPAHEQIEDP